MRVILDVKYEKEDLNKVLKNQWKILTKTQHYELLKLFKKNEEIFNGTLVTWKIYSVEFELKEYLKPVCSRQYLLPKVQREMLKKKRLNI